MADDSVETKLARLEGRVDHLENVADDHHLTLNGPPGSQKEGIINELRSLRTENRYLRLVYVLGTALALPIINGIITKLGYGPIKIGGE